MEQALENQPAGRATQNLLAGAFRMWHQARHISRCVANAGDIVERPVGVCALSGFALSIDIPPEDLLVRLEPAQSLFIREIAAFAMGDRQAQRSEEHTSELQSRFGISY